MEICRRRTCAPDQIELAFDATGTEVRTPRSLAPGVWFWRVSSAPANSVGPVWEFTVGARDAPRASAWGCHLDVDGDGLVDLAVGDTVAGLASVYRGRPGGLNTAPDQQFVFSSGNPRPVLTAALASACDVNGDGYGDLVVGMSFNGAANVFLGGPTGLDTGHPLALQLPTGDSFGFGGAVAGAGDVNGDGYGDVVIGAYQALNVHGEAYVYYGGPGGPSGQPSVRIAHEQGYYSGFGLAVTGAFDANGDGFSDVAVGAPFANSDVGSASVYAGSATGIDPTHPLTLNAPTPGRFGIAIAGAGDVDGDGFGDLIIGAYYASDGRGLAYVFSGSASGVSTAPATTLSHPDPTAMYFGSNMDGGGDVNADGFSDVMISAAMPHCGAQVFLGSSRGVSPTSAMTVLRDSMTGLIGPAVAIVGDMDGDHDDEFAVGAATAMGEAGPAPHLGAVDVFLGDPTQIDAASAVRLEETGTATPTTNTFGDSVARRARARPPVVALVPRATRRHVRRID